MTETQGAGGGGGLIGGLIGGLVQRLGTLSCVCLGNSALPLVLRIQVLGLGAVGTLAPEGPLSSEDSLAIGLGSVGTLAPEGEGGT